MSPTLTTSRRLPSSPARSSWTRRRSSPTKVFPRTPSTMTLHSRVCFVKLAHRENSHHSQREDLSVSLSSSVSDRTVQPVGDTAERPAEQSSQEADSARRTKRANSCQARINRHEFQAAYHRSLLQLFEIVESQQEELHCARAEEVLQRDQQLLQGSYCSKIWNYVKLTRKVSLKWKS